MRTKLFLQVISVCLLTPLFSFAQDCSQGLAFKEGARFEIQSFNEKDKMESKAVHVVRNVTTNGAATEAKLFTDITDSKGKPVGSSNYKVTCESGVYKVNMENMVNPQMLKSYEGMNVTIQGDNLEVPSSGIAGQTLADGKLVITIQGPIKMNNTIDVTNRKVEGTENITTPAGTFECIKISYDVNMKFVVKVNSKVEEWYAPETGMVLSKTYDSKGKLQGYSQLTSISK